MWGINRELLKTQLGGEWAAQSCYHQMFGTKPLEVDKCMLEEARSEKRPLHNGSVNKGPLAVGSGKQQINLTDEPDDEVVETNFDVS